MTKEQKNCPFCHQTPVFLRNSIGTLDVTKCQKELTSGEWTTLYIGVDPKGHPVLRACGDDCTDDYYPKFCPECGRRLDTPPTRLEKN